MARSVNRANYYIYPVLSSKMECCSLPDIVNTGSDIVCLNCDKVEPVKYNSIMYYKKDRYEKEISECIIYAVSAISISFSFIYLYFNI